MAESDTSDTAMGVVASAVWSQQSEQGFFQAAQTALHQLQRAEAARDQMQRRLFTTIDEKGALLRQMDEMKRIIKGFVASHDAWQAAVKSFMEPLPCDCELCSIGRTILKA